MSLPAVSDDRFPLRTVACSHGDVAWREAGRGLPLVLLHGIGSGSGSWAGQLDGLASVFRVVAWDAPGYGGSAALPSKQPLAADYVRVLDEWLERLGIDELVLLGHSLGAVTAAAHAAHRPAGLRALVLVSPARGYGKSDPGVRDAKYRERIDLVERLGVEGMAAQRSAGLCASHAKPEALAAVRANMARATPGGYAQAAHLLAFDDLASHLTRVAVPRAVLCGELDKVTPADSCRAVADTAGAPFVLLPNVAHACYVEDPAQFNTALLAALADIGVRRG